MPIEVTAARDDVNAVRIRGRVSTTPERRHLPSGDEVVALRVVVRRGDGSTVDAIEVSVGPAPGPGARRGEGQVGRRVLAAAERLAVDDRVEVVGQLRRRWWDAGGARRSRLEVRGTSVARIVEQPEPTLAPQDPDGVSSSSASASSSSLGSSSEGTRAPGSARWTIA